MPTATKKQCAPQAQIEIRGQVKRIHFASDGFTAGIFRVSGGDETGFAIKMGGIAQGDYLSLHGHWKNDPKYGKQFAAQTFSYPKDISTDGLIHYLATTPEFKNIGPQRAREIAERFGENFESVLADTPELLLTVRGITRETVTLLQAVWKSRSAFNVVSTELAAWELTPHQIQTLIGIFGGAAAEIIKENPYMLIESVNGYGFKKADIIARKIGIPKATPGRIRAGILYCMEDLLSQGSTCISRDRLIDFANELLIIDRLDAKRLIEAVLTQLVEDGNLTEFAADGGDNAKHIALTHIYNREREVIAALRDANCVAVEPMPPLENELLNDVQRQAAEQALSNRISVITGGAGTGKTFTVTHLCNCYADADLTVALCAPTGKAAKRMQESSGRPAQTIHRLLEHNGREFVRDEFNKLDCNVIIVDEFSMVDILLCHALFKAIDFEQTRVIIVGDHNQLPPVGPGNLLRDIIARELVPVTTLTQVVRQAGILKENSQAILRGAVAPTAKGAGAWYVIHESEPDGIIKILKDVYLNRLRQHLCVADLINDVQCLTPQHKGPLGTEALNIVLQRMLQRELYKKDVPPPTGKIAQARLCVGDRVIQTKNDYKTNTMNGATGRVTCIEPEITTCEFDGEAVEFEKDTRASLQVAYACTVHKLQGSEIDVVVIVCHKAHSFMHHRNLLYTAVTRAKRAVIIIGDTWGIKSCAQKICADKRMTLLSCGIGETK